jgi:hypothetical protein
MEVWCATNICHMRGALPFHAPWLWGPDTPGDGACWGPHMRGAPLVRCATNKEGSVAHIARCTTATYPWSTKMECAVDNGPMDNGFPSSAYGGSQYGIALFRGTNTLLCSTELQESCGGSGPGHQLIGEGAGREECAGGRSAGEACAWR